MEALIRTGAVSSCCSSPALPNRMAKNAASLPGPHCGLGGSAVQCARRDGHRMILLRVLDRSKLRKRFDTHSGRSNYSNSYGPPILRFRIRATNESAGSNVDEKVREIASDDAVEGPSFADRDAKLKADELKAEGGSGGEATELPVAAELLLSALKEEDEAADSALVEKDAVLGLASESSVEDPQHFFRDVNEEAQQTAAKLGESVEEKAVGLENKAEELENRQVKEAELVKKGEFDEDDETSSGTSSDESSDDESDSDNELPKTRAEAERKFVKVAKDGIEVLKWAAEGVVSAGQNSGQGLEVAKKELNKRLESFGVAADDTKSVSSKAAEATQTKLNSIHGSASKFGEELQVNVEEKKAADSLKPESERNPLTKVATDVQENFNKATTGDGPLAKLNEAVSENLSKASQAGQDFTARVSERAAELSDRPKESTEESKSDLKSDIATDYEDERGNELLEGQISSNGDSSTLKFDADEAQAVPSKKEDGSDIGPDE